MVLVKPADNTSQPFAHFGHRFVHALPKLLLDLLQLRLNQLPCRLPPDYE